MYKGTLFQVGDFVKTTRLRKTVKGRVFAIDPDGVRIKVGTQDRKIRYFGDGDLVLDH